MGVEDKGVWEVGGPNPTATGYRLQLPTGSSQTERCPEIMSLTISIIQLLQ